MLRSVQFDNQLCFCAVEVCNILAQNLLSRKPDRVLSKKLIPQAAFFFCHVLSERSGKRDQMFVSLIIHFAFLRFSGLRCDPSGGLSAATSPCAGEAFGAHFHVTTRTRRFTPSVLTVCSYLPLYALAAFSTPCSISSRAAAAAFSSAGPSAFSSWAENLLSTQSARS